MTPIRLTAILAASLAMLCGCASYKAGAGIANTESIWIAPAINQSYMPQIASVLTERVREAFLSDNIVRIVRKDAADTRLDITIDSVNRESRASGPYVARTTETSTGTKTEETRDNGLDKAYDIILTARAVLTDSKTDRVILDRTYTTSTQALPHPYTLTSADDERMLMPILARDLARQIHDDIAHRWDEPSANEK